MFLIFLFLSFLLALSSGQDLSSLPNCTSDFREFNGICTSHGRLQQRLWGSTNRIYFTYFVGRDARVPVGNSRPSARLISNKLFNQGGNIFDARGLNEMVAYFGQFILHDISLTPMSEDERFDIPVPAGDKAGMFRDAIPFFRSLREGFRARDSEELPINDQSSAIDLSTIYGASKLRNNAVRTGQGGMMSVSRGGLPSIVPEGRLENLPESSRNYFLTGDPRSNENPVLTSICTVFIREHNRITRELAGLFPELTDEKLFMAARSINSAQFQKIVFDEWYPAVTNRNLPLYISFQQAIDPTISATFSTAGFQIYHSMTGRNIRRRGPGNILMTPLKKADSFFRTVSTLQEDGVEPYLRGAFSARAQAIDAKISSTRRNRLYSKIPGLENRVDIAAEIVQRSRDHAIPSYNKIRAKFGMPKAAMIDDITSDRDTSMALKELYGRPSTIDAYPGMLAEDHADDSSMGPTLLSLWRREFIRLRNGDRFYFRSREAFPSDLKDVPTVKKLLSDEDTFRRIILDNTKVKAGELPRKMFFIR